MARSDDKDRYAELDFMRAVAIIGVVAIHVFAITLTKLSTDQFTLVLSLIVNQLSRFCVPLFLFVSGILAYHSYKRNSYLELLKGKVTALLVPYLIWTTIGFLFFLTYSINYKGIIVAILTGSGPFYQLYYLPLLLQMFVVLPLLVKYASGKKSVIAVCAVTMILCAAYEVILMKNFLSSEAAASANLYLQSSFVMWMVYVCSGIYAARNYGRWVQFIASTPAARLLAVYLVAAAALLAEAYMNFIVQKHVEAIHYFRVTVMVYSFASIALLFKLGMKYKPKVLTHLYTNSFGVYLVHVAVIKGISLILPPFAPNVVFITVYMLATMIISYWLVEGLKRTPLALALFGQNVRGSKSDARAKSDKMMIVNK